jgi:hypothetical protein
VDDTTGTSTSLRMILRWVARGWSILSLVFVTVIFVGEALHPTTTVPITPRDVLALPLFPLGTYLGLVLAWRWEGLGGAITIGSLLAFYVALFLMDGRFPRGPFFALVATPGVLFLASRGISSRLRRERNHPSSGARTHLGAP